jgi:hypothetical protein
MDNPKINKRALSKSQIALIETRKEKKLMKDKQTRALTQKQLYLIEARRERKRIKEQKDKDKAKKERKARRLKAIKAALKKFQKQEKIRERRINREKALTPKERKLLRDASKRQRELFVPPPKEELKKELSKPLNESSSPLLSRTLLKNTGTKPRPNQ